MLEAHRFPALDELTPDGRALIAARRTPFEYSPRQAVIHCGQPVDGTFFVTAGDLRVYIQSAEGREKTLYHIRPGQTCILAVNAAFTGLVYPAWVAAGEEPTRGFVLPAATYRELFENEPALRDFTVTVLTGWIYDLMTAVEEGALQSIEERLAHALVRRSDAAGTVRGTHQDLASDLGETTDLAARHPERVSALAAELDAWFGRVEAQPSIDIESGAPIGLPGTYATN